MGLELYSAQGSEFFSLKGAYTRQNHTNFSWHSVFKTRFGVIGSWVVKRCVRVPAR